MDRFCVSWNNPFSHRHDIPCPGGIRSRSRQLVGWFALSSGARRYHFLWRVIDWRKRMDSADSPRHLRAWRKCGLDRRLALLARLVGVRLGRSVRKVFVANGTPQGRLDISCARLDGTLHPCRRDCIQLVFRRHKFLKVHTKRISPNNPALKKNLSKGWLGRIRSSGFEGFKKLAQDAQPAQQATPVGKDS
jgi:hypothetical protein